MDLPPALLSLKFKAPSAGPEESFYFNLPAPVAVFARQNKLLSSLKLLIAFKYKDANGFSRISAKEVSRKMGCCRQSAAKYIRQLEVLGWIQKTSTKGVWNIRSWKHIATGIYGRNPELMTAWRKKASWNKKIKIKSGISLDTAIDIAFLLDSERMQKKALEFKRRKGVDNLCDVDYPAMTGKRFSNFLNCSPSFAAKRLQQLSKNLIIRESGFLRKAFPLKTACSVSNAFVHNGHFFLSFPAFFSVRDSLGIEVVRRY